MGHVEREHVNDVEANVCVGCVEMYEHVSSVEPLEHVGSMELNEHVDNVEMYGHVAMCMNMWS